MELDRRQYLVGMAGGLAAFNPVGAVAQSSIVTPEQFGARGDGRTNDTRAFAAMTAHVNARGGGEIALRPVEYLVGSQAWATGPGQHYAFVPAPIMDFRRCRLPLIIRGHGARLRCAAGLRYGTFDRASGLPTRHPMPSLRADELATPYRAMLRVEECSGGIEIRDLELDGEVRGLRIGGQYGDVGWQIPACGIQLVNNDCAELLSRLHLHHHALDGLLIDGLERRASASRIEGVRSEYNGRQGCSITGGRGYDFVDCSFSHTGRAGLSSAPGAGVDLEAEAGKRVHDISFTNCRFSNNKGAGLVADSGRVERAVFKGCTFIGTTNWAVWPNKPAFRFAGCTFVGPIVHAYGDADPAQACQFRACRFLDDPALSPTGQVYGGENPSRPIADLPNNPNVLFDRCRFELTHRAVLPWTTNVVIFSNCMLSQRAAAMSYPRGTFLGTNMLRGRINLYSARILGTVVLNGVRQQRTAT